MGEAILGPRETDGGMGDLEVTVRMLNCNEDGDEASRPRVK